jgi:TonB-linked SusC/RagA family outer membrane protein
MRLFTAIVLWMLWAGSVQGQTQLNVTGRVLDEAGQLLPGVNIIIKGTTIGVTTDATGEFTIAAPPDAVLLFSFIGYTSQEIKVDNQTALSVVMAPDVQSLNEVVIVGYTTQSKSTLTSAVEKVDTREMRYAPNVNPVQSLQGKIAGVSVPVLSGQPGANAKIIIRGGTGTNPYGSGTGGGRDNSLSNSGDAGALYVIDGVYRNDMNDLNSNDIESIQVLKDAASTSIYGARGANGIIVVTTKSGRSKAGKPTLTFRYQHSIEKLNTNRGYEFASGRDYLIKARTAALAAVNDPNSVAGRASGGAFMYSTVSITNPGDYGQQKYTPVFLNQLVTIEGQAYVDNLINHQGYEIIKDPITGNDILFKDNHYQDVVWQTAHTNNYNVNLSGANDNGNYYVGLGYIDQEGIYLGTGYKRFSILANGEHRLRDNLTANIGVSYQRNDNQYPRNYTDMTRSVRVPTTWRLYYDDGTPGLGEGNASPRNRLHELYYQHLSSVTDRITTHFGFDWEILPGLHFKPSGSFYKDNLEENFSEDFFAQKTSRDIAYFHRFNEQVMADGLLTYELTVSKHNVNALLGTNYTATRYYDISPSSSGRASNYIEDISATPTANHRVGVNSRTRDKYMSYFGQLNYDYDARYLFSASARYDGFSRFSNDKKFALFPAVSAGWNIHREAFWENANVPVVSSLKVRASWGEAGYNSLDYANTQGAYSSGYNYGGQAGITYTTLRNGDLVWETSATTDLAVDMGLFNNRLNLSVDYYNKITRDRLFNQPLPTETGFSSIRANVGTLRNRGVEIGFGGTVLEQGGFKWESNFTFAFNRGIVLKLPDNGRDKNRINGGTVFDPNTGEYIEVGGLAEGERYGGLWAFKLDGVYATTADAASAPVDQLVSGNKQGKPKVGGDAIWRDVDSNGIIDSRDVVFIGYRAPDKIGGWVNTFSYKGITLRFVVDYALGHVINNGPLARGMANGRNNEAMPALALSNETWQKEGDIAKYPRWDNASDFDNGYRNHLRGLSGVGVTGVGIDDGYSSDVSLYYKKGDFLAFREISVAYQVPKTLSEKIHIPALTINIGAHNLGYITEYDGLTPEIYKGYDEGVYPRPRQFTIGATATF